MEGDDPFAGSALPMPIPDLLENEYKEVAWGVQNYGDKFSPMWIPRPKCQDFDVKIDMLYCGICHSDCHLVKNHLGGSMYPIVPGHELIGKVVEVGPKVTRF